ncbi:hypothetical protein IDM40_00780 [Nocardiopsis sp. HNM0947]|uniref:Uncharacterized protein n=1 Tax=Nocardiopsis coralli TaxID=2772213 RepID=A0ABR9P093_9ACTN|nr:hypothetical protein [Nocardiopsis coralli]MBE2997240.1 hypothetical protein [Nocardiopsis coralli]
MVDALVALRAELEHVLIAEVEFLEGSPWRRKVARLLEVPASDTYVKFEGGAAQNDATAGMWSLVASRIASVAVIGLLLIARLHTVWIPLRIAVAAVTGVLGPWR